MNIVNQNLNAVLDSLDTHIAVIDSEGIIQYVNQAWIHFGLSNGIQRDVNWIGGNYLSLSVANDDDMYSLAIFNGLHAVIDNKTSAFVHEYPCHSPTENRWYLFRVVPLESMSGCFVISHQNITRNKLVEQRAERLSLEDPLTGLFNRRGLDTFAGEEFSRAIRHELVMSVIIIDVDYFKYFNDCYGHHAGDQCLINIAKIIQYHTRRPGDIAARIGGDEFVLILSQTPKEEALCLGHTLRQKTYGLAMMLPNEQRVTISVGITTLIPELNSDYKEWVYKYADTALYVAKKRRNSVFFVNDIEK